MEYNQDLDALLNQRTKPISDAVKTIQSFQKGYLKPLKTSLEHLNKACLGGLIPGLIITIGARPSHGKSYTLHQIRNDIMNDNTVKSKMLLYNWEMPWFSLILTQLKKKLNKSYKDLLSMTPNIDEARIINEEISKLKDDRLTTVSKSLKPSDYDYVTRRWIENNKQDSDLLIVATDHIGITVGTDKTKAIYELLEIQNSIKLDYPSKVTFINLGQLNRSIETVWRSSTTNPVGLRVTSEHLFGSDAMMQYSDVILAQVIPDRANLELYTSVNREHYEHLYEHFSDHDGTSDYTRLKGVNRIYYDYVKKRLPEDGEPSLYCSVLSKAKEEFILETSNRERDLTDNFEIDNIEF